MACKTHNRKDCTIHDGLLLASIKINLSLTYTDLPWWLIGKESACNAGDVGSITESGRSPGEGNGNPLAYSCLENPTDRGTWQATVHGVRESGHDWALMHTQSLSIKHQPQGKDCQFSSVQLLSQVWPVVTPWIAPCPSPAPGVYSNSRPLSQWCHPTISSSVIPFSSCPQSFPASGSFPMSQLFTFGGQNIAVSASTSVLPVTIQDWSPLGWTGWISLQSKGLSRVFSNTTVKCISSSGLSLF